MKIGQFNIGSPANVATLVTALKRSMDPIVNQLNNISGGTSSAFNNLGTAPPTGSTTRYAVGDEIRNSAPSVLGVAGSSYIIIGWKCITAGAPGVWVEMRCTTGT